ncbi:unnamed protein product [Clonostachys rosea]|uniref:F-box domain-containing protein n=1 Tax=Bionectria ochroleuca TaxID=29856 RepID=A0ABY6UKW3_BIOOC|nr:unnamed protein product [Clonostachys rosea]
MSHLLKLPTELLAYIMGMLVTSIGPSHIHKMLLVCKCLYEIALPLSVHVFRNTPPLSVGTGDCSGRRNAQFLRYILIDKPKLARLVKVIVIGNVRSSTSRRILPHCASTVSTHRELDIYAKRIRQAIEPVSRFVNTLDLCTAWTEDLRRGFSEAQLALIMLSCKKVRTLYIAQEDQLNIIPMVLDLSAHVNNLPYSHLPPAPFCNLEEVYCETGHRRTGRDLWDFTLRLMRLPRLRVYEAMLGDCSRVGDHFPDEPSRSSPVRDIVMNQSNITVEMVRGILGACKAVEKFELSKFIHNDKCASMCVCVRVAPGYHASLFNFVSARQVLRLILPHRHTLTYLRLVLHDSRARSMRLDDSWLVHMGPQLRELTALQTLEVEMESLIANDKFPPHEVFPRLVDCIPTNLVNLQIQNCNALSLEPAAELLGVVESGDTFTQLRQIRLLFDADSGVAQDVDLVLNSPTTTLSVVFQSHDCFVFDLGPTGTTANRNMPAVFSRVYAEDVRENWLALRGTVSPSDSKSKDPNKPVFPPKMRLDYRDEAVEYLM